MSRNLYGSLMLWRRLSVLQLIAVFALAGCGIDKDAGIDESVPITQSVEIARDVQDVRVRMINTSFDDEPCSLWTTYAARDGDFSLAEIKPLDIGIEPDGNGYAISSSPWWIDPNHAFPGAGYLNLIAVAYYEGWFGVDGAVRNFHLGNGKPLDMSNALVKVRYRAPMLTLAPESTLVFWFQTRALDPVSDAFEYVNYALTSQPLPIVAGDFSWQEVELLLSSDSESWTCLGSNDDRDDVYGCAGTVRDALTRFETDLGLVILSPDEGSAMSSTGAVEIDHISMLVPTLNKVTHAKTMAYLDIEPNTCGNGVTTE